MTATDGYLLRTDALLKQGGWGGEQTVKGASAFLLPK